MQVLPWTSTAKAEVDAKWLCAVGGVFNDLYYRTFEKAAFDFRKSRIHNIAGSATFQENDKAVDFRHALSFRCHGVNLDIFDYVALSHG